METQTAPDGKLDERAERALAIYDSQLKAILEPEFVGKFVSIHIDSGDYAVAPYAGDAIRKMRETYNKGSLVTMKIGSEPEYGLAARLLAGQAVSVKK